MRLLIDTQVFLWLVVGDARLPRGARQSIADRSNDVFLSAASAWEIALKATLGRLPLPPLPRNWVGDAAARLGFVALPIDLEHAFGAGTLPTHHRDPFDRMLIAQAQAEGLTIVTVDRAFERYDVPLLFA